MTDEPDTQPTEHVEPPGGDGGSPPRPRRLLRSRDQRIVGGAASGIGDYFGIDPVIVRIGFAIAAFIGGVGVVAYAALVLFVPSDDGSEQPASFAEQSPGRMAVAALVFGALAILIVAPLPFGWWGDPFAVVWPLGLLALAGAAYLIQRTARSGGWTTRRVLALLAVSIPGFFLACGLAIASAWAGAEGYGEAVAAVVLGLGVVMVAASFSRRARWLVVPALLLAAPLGVVAAADFDLEGGYGERTFRPDSIAALPDDGYRMAAGEMSVDLTRLDWRRGQTVDLDLELGMGAMKVLVPQGVCVEADGDAFAGVLDVRGNRAEGVDIDLDERHRPSSAPRLRLDLELGLGELQVRDRSGDFSDGHGRFDDARPDRESRRAARALEACASA